VGSVTGASITGTSVHPIRLRTVDASGTQSLAAAIAARCRTGDVLLLVGDLGAGKTTFAQGFGRSLGIEEPITSPTFTLVRQYPVSGTGQPPVEWLIHADVYRLDRLQEITDLGIGELVEDGGVALVEWGDAAAPVLGEGSLTVRLEAVPHQDHGVGNDEEDGDNGVDQGRMVTVSATGDRWDARWAGLVEALSRWAVR
jgi:tRNA threonylcarbamoyladenosine biosynthesis protein TsaE